MSKSKINEEVSLLKKFTPDFNSAVNVKLDVKTEMEMDDNSLDAVKSAIIAATIFGCFVVTAKTIVAILTTD